MIEPDWIGKAPESCCDSGCSSCELKDEVLADYYHDSAKEREWEKDDK